MVFRHPLHPQGKHNSHDGGKPFRHGCYGKGYCQQQGIDDIFAGMEPFCEPQGKHNNNSNGDDRDAEHFGYFIHFFLQRGSIFLCFRQHICNLADLGAHTCTCDYSSACALCNGCTVENHVSPVSQGFRRF